MCLGSLGLAMAGMVIACGGYSDPAQPHAENPVIPAEEPGDATPTSPAPSRIRRRPNQAARFCRLAGRLPRPGYL
jgi:hypothetical protein